MPKGFTEHEKELIRAKLLEAGQTLFGTFGLKKTTVQEIAAKAGIAKGSFYLFFGSKEELFMEIMGTIEKTIQGQILKEFQNVEVEPGKALKKLILKQFEVVENYPMLKILFNQGELEALIRKMPNGKMEEGLEVDVLFAEKLLGPLQNKGVIKEMDLKIVAGALRGIFLMSFYKEEAVGEDFPAVMDFMVSAIIEKIMVK